MVDYKNSKIYKLSSDQSKTLYIGTTTQPLKTRLVEHLYNIKHGRTQNSIRMRDHTNIQIELLEYYPCETKIELFQRENKYIDFYRKISYNTKKAHNTIEDIRFRKKMWARRNRFKKRLEKMNIILSIEI